MLAAHEHQHFVVTNQPRLNVATRGVIPPLDTKGDVYKTWGPNDLEIYGTTTGDKKLIMVYTHFKDLGVPKVSTQDIEKKMYGDGRFLDFFALYPKINFFDYDYIVCKLPPREFCVWRAQEQGHHLPRRFYLPRRQYRQQQPGRADLLSRCHTRQR